MNNGLLCAALEYVESGWPVLPLHRPIHDKDNPRKAARCSCGESECTARGKHPRTRSGLKDACVDPEQVRRWWDDWPSANIGIATGVAFDVLDIDGPEAESALCERIGQTPICGLEVETGRGRHMLFAPTGHHNRAKLGGIDKLDYRGLGGYVVAPPSRHPSGRVYRWISGPHRELEGAPIWLRNILGPPIRQPATRKTRTAPRASDSAYLEAALKGELERLGQAAEGERNTTLNNAAFRIGQLTGDNHSLQDAAKRLFVKAIDIGLSRTEAEKTIYSGIRSGLQKPRSK